MSLVVMIALGLIPWVIAIERLIRGRSRDLEASGDIRVPEKASDAGPTAPAAANLLADDTLFGAINTETPSPAADRSRPADPPARAPAAGPTGPDALRGVAVTTEDAAMAISTSSLAHAADRQWPRISPDLAIIDGFIPGDDMLELTLDETEVAAAEQAGVRLDIRVERSSTGRGSLITVGGTPLAFVRGSTQVSPRDVVLRIDRLDDHPAR